MVLYTQSIMDYLFQVEDCKVTGNEHEISHSKLISTTHLSLLVPQIG